MDSRNLFIPIYSPVVRDDFEEPAYIATWNAARKSKIPDVADLAENDMSDSPTSSHMKWGVPNGKKLRANHTGRNGIY